MLIETRLYVRPNNEILVQVRLPDNTLGQRRVKTCQEVYHFLMDTLAKSEAVIVEALEGQTWTTKE